MTYLLHRLVGENVTHQLLHPLLIGLRRSRVPPVQAVELEWHRPSQVMDGVSELPTSTLHTLPRPRSKSL